MLFWFSRKLGMKFKFNTAQYCSLGWKNALNCITAAQTILVLGMFSPRILENMYRKLDLTSGDKWNGRKSVTVISFQASELFHRKFRRIYSKTYYLKCS